MRLSTVPIALDEITVEITRTDLRNASTYEGLYARRGRAQVVGRERVVVRGDREMANADRVRDVLRLFAFQLTPGRSICVDYYVNGLPRDSLAVLDIPTDLVEGIEYYVDGRIAPQAFTGGRCVYQQWTVRFSVVGVWYARP